MKRSLSLANPLILALMIALSFAVGLLIPAYYDWTGADQSRPSPLVLPTAVGILVAGAAFSCVVARLPMPDVGPSSGSVGRMRLTIRSLLAMTLVTALLLATLVESPRQAVGGVAWIVSILFLTRLAWLVPSSRLPVATLLACAYLPFAWVIPWSASHSLSGGESLLMSMGLPSILPLLLVGTLVKTHPQELGWLALLLTACWLFLGAWMIRSGPKRSIIHFTCLMIVSVFGSFALNAAFRI